MPRSRLAILLAGASALLFAGAVLWRNFYLFEIYCQKSYDLGIFLEILRENAKGEWNPWLNTRQIFQFSDHWTLIISLVARLSPFPLVFTALVGEVFCFLAAAAALFWLSRRNLISIEWIALVVMCFFLNRDQFEAAYFPIHESTWAVAPLIGLAVVLISGLQIGWRWTHRLGILLLSGTLCIFSEQFGFAVLGLSLGLTLFGRERAFGIVLAAFGAGLVWWLSFGRESFFTPIFPYYQQRILISPSEFLEKWRPDFNAIKTLILHIVGYGPPLVLIWKERKQLKDRWRGWVVLMGLFGPLILGRLIAGNFHLQYGVALTATWVVTLIWFFPQIEISKKYLGLSFLFLLIFSNNKLRMPFATAFGHTGLECARGARTNEEMQARQVRLDRAFLTLERNVIPGTRILAAGNLVPNLLVRFPQAEVYHLGSYAIVSAPQVDWLILETEPFGESHYLRPQGALEVVELAKRSPGVHVFEDSDGLFMARGPFDLAAFAKFYHEHPPAFISRPGATP